MLSLTGLSPLARGTLNSDVARRIPGRFIPAGAGNTIHVFIVFHSCAVYPRWRGEHAEGNVYVLRKTGLSPLARGTLKAVWGWFTKLRFIPAGAGNTGYRPRILAVPSGLSPLARGTR